LLLLDEVTSQLDADNELAGREALVRVSGERTVMVIAYRLSTVTDADRIIVLEEGRVAGVGTHEELLASNPLYRRLATSQLADVTPGTAYESPE
jgi:ABC-type multidrug transport system fused ATPase/permease subunit